MHLTEAVLAPLRERYGEPRALRWEGEVSPEEFALAGGSPERRHDVTFFAFDPADRLDTQEHVGVRFLHPLLAARHELGQQHDRYDRHHERQHHD